jgi:glycosyltransferase involved in cell wall biosynthesis
MKVIGITMVKDEVDIIETTISHMLTQVDGVIALDNGSTDGTFGRLCNLLGNKNYCDVLNTYELGYFQSKRMTELAEVARCDFLADWVVPFDADEIWLPIPDYPTIKDVLESHHDSYGIVPAMIYDHVATGFDPDIENPIDRMVYRRQERLPLNKVACRTAHNLVIEQGNHWARYDIPARACDPALIIHHYPYRSAEQMIKKVRNGGKAYEAMGDQVPENVGSHWRNWYHWSDEQIAECFRKWYWRHNPVIGIEIEGEKQTALIGDRPKCITNLTSL